MRVITSGDNLNLLRLERFKLSSPDDDYVDCYTKMDDGSYRSFKGTSNAGDCDPYTFENHQKLINYFEEKLK